jgi:hypothetical protein
MLKELRNAVEGVASNRTPTTRHDSSATLSRSLRVPQVCYNHPALYEIVVSPPFDFPPSPPLPPLIRHSE